MVGGSRQLEQLLKSARFTTNILRFVLLFSLVIYVGVVYMLSQQGPEKPVPEMFPLALGVVTLMQAGAIVMLPRFMLSDSRLRAATGPDAPMPQPSLAGTVEALPDHEKRLGRVPMVHFTPFILGLVLSESIGIYGLVLSMMSNTLPPMLPFIGVAAALMLFAVPSLDSVLERVSRLTPGH